MHHLSCSGLQNIAKLRATASNDTMIDQGIVMNGTANIVSTYMLTPRLIG